MGEVIGYLLRHGGVVFAMALSALGVGFGQGIAGGDGSSAMARQHLASGPNQRAMLLGLAFIESGGVFAFVITLLLLFGFTGPVSLAQGIAQMGAGFGIGLSALIVGISSGFVMRGAMRSIARQPFVAAKITSLMLLTQALLEAPVVFAFIISLLVYTATLKTITIAYGWQLCGAGMIVGLGAVGPAIGQAIFSSSACRAVGINPEVYSRVFSFALITQALIETPVIFCLILSFIMLFTTVSPALALVHVVAGLLGAVVSMGVGSMGAAIGSGHVAARAVVGLANNPDMYSMLFRMAFLCQAIIDSALIYSLITAFMLLMQLR